MVLIGHGVHLLLSHLNECRNRDSSTSLFATMIHVLNLLLCYNHGAGYESLCTIISPWGPSYLWAIDVHHSFFPRCPERSMSQNFPKIALFASQEKIDTTCKHEPEA